MRCATAARELGLTPDHGVSVRLTGSVALSDDEFASLTQGIGYATTLSLTLVGIFLFLAVRSPKLILAIATTLVVGLIGTAAFAAAAIGSLNLISVAFAVLFVGLAVDFGIQFSVRYRDCRFHVTHLSAALREAAAGMSASLPLAAATTAVGFYAFVPSDYAGVRELGLIAGTGMLIAVVLNFTLLPAMIALLRPRGEPEVGGLRRRGRSRPVAGRSAAHGRGDRDTADRARARHPAVPAFRFRSAQSQGPAFGIDGDLARPHGQPDRHALHHRRPAAFGRGGRRARRSPQEAARGRQGRHRVEPGAVEPAGKARHHPRRRLRARALAVAAGGRAGADRRPDAEAMASLAAKLRKVAAGRSDAAPSLRLADARRCRAPRDAAAARRRCATRWSRGCATAWPISSSR